MLTVQSIGQAVSVCLLAALFFGSGVKHLINPTFYLPMMPTYLPRPFALIIASGLFEIAGGVGILLPGLRKAAGWGLIALLVAVFPVHVFMVRNPALFADIPFWVLVARLPMQALLMFWVWVATIRDLHRTPQKRHAGPEQGQADSGQADLGRTD